MSQPTAPNLDPGGNGGPPVDWAAALAQHRRWLRTVVRGRVGDPQAVDDVMQEVALAATRQRAPLADPTKVAPWLYRVAVRQTLLFRRRMGRQRNLTRRYASRAELSDAGKDTGDPLRWIMDAERQQKLREAISRLSVGDNEILMLKHTEGWSYQQLADHLGLSLNAVEYRLLRARRRLRQQLLEMKIDGQTE